MQLLHSLLHSSLQWLPLLLRPHGRNHGFHTTAHLLVVEQTPVLFSLEGSNIGGNSSILCSIPVACSSSQKEDWLILLVTLGNDMYTLNQR